MVEDLPAPLGPSKAKISPDFTSNDKSSTASTSEYCFVIWLTNQCIPSSLITPAQ
jgi:hypothetical protein